MSADIPPGSQPQQRPEARASQPGDVKITNGAIDDWDDDEGEGAESLPTATALDIALMLAARGLAVFPCTASKRPAIPEVAGGRGCLDATVDADRVRALFARAPNAALVGVACGPASGVDVLDIDPRHGGEVWEQQHHNRLPETLIHRTPSGGRHHVFRHHPGVRNRQGAPAAGVDVRGEGGYAVWPPSAGYNVAHDVQAAEWPQWLLDQIIRTEPPPRPFVPTNPADISDARLDGLLRSLLARLSEAPEGQKHEILLRIARTVGGYDHLFGLSDEQLVEMMLGALPDTVEDWKNAEATARAGLAYGRTAPLDLENRPLRHANRRPTPPASDCHVDEAFDDPGYLESLETDEPASPSGRTILKVLKGEYVQTAEQIETIATAAALPIYSHGEGLCRPVTEQRRRYDGVDVTVAVLRNYTTASLRRAIDPAIGFNKYDGRRKAFVACEPPADIISMVLAGAQKQIFPPIRGIIGTPILRPDRTIVATPGYDAVTGYYVVDPPDMPPIPTVPTRDDALQALTLLTDLISEFPFADDVSRSVAISGLITPLVRAACDVVPGHLLTAPKQGSGKSLLVDTTAAIATGERAYAILAHRQPEEQDKQLTGALLEGRQIIALDNLIGEIESAVLAQVTERERVSVRPLGTSQTVAIVNSFNTYLTGNNVTVAGDNIRRLLVCRIDPQVENPLDRTFEKPNPVTRVFKGRGTYISAILTIVTAYIAQGQPCRLTPTPSYAAWSELVREPLVWLGLPDPTDSMRVAFDDDPNNASLAALMAAWPTSQTDWTCAELIAAAMAGNTDLAEALKPIARDRRGVFDISVLGNYLRLNRDKIVGGQKITRHRASAQGGIARWVLT
jgi:putative DNA primase/helicase